MSNQLHARPASSTSITRRLERLRAEIEVIFARPQRPASPKTVIQYRKARDRMLAQNKAPETIAKECRRSYNLYRAALVYFAVQDLWEAIKTLSARDRPPTAEAHELVTIIEDRLAIL